MSTDQPSSAKKPLSGVEVARLAGYDKALVTRLRQKGMSDEAIIRKGQERQKRKAAKSASQVSTVVEMPTAAELVLPGPAGKPDSLESYSEAQARKERALADKHELDVAKESAKLIEVAAVRETWSGIASRLTSMLLGIPNTLAPRLAQLSDPHKIRTLLDQEIRHALTSLPSQIEEYRQAS